MGAHRDGRRGLPAVAGVRSTTQALSAAAERVRLGRGIARDRGWGGSTGAEVDGAVVDSGTEDGHPLVGRVDSADALTHGPAAPEGVRVVEGPHADLFGHGTASPASSGHSFAAPHVAGLVARVLATHPGLTPFQRKTVPDAVADSAVVPGPVDTPDLGG